VRALAQALGIGLFDTYDSGDNVYLNNGQRSTFSDSSPTGSAPLDPVILPDLTTAVTQLDQMAAEIPVDAPWTAAMQRVLQGALIKAGAVYDRPWWRDKGLNGSSVSTDGLVSATFDDSPRTRAWACSSGSSAATRRASSTPWRATTARARC